MEQRPIEPEEGNATISEFMGQSADYRNDWSALMKVVDKIEKLFFHIEIINHSTMIFDGQYHATFRSHLYHRTYNGMTRIEACWVSCVYFAEHYKENQKGS
ncbi:MAG: hypothetical protein H7282_05130 [Cytophagaceae bacterium]|nr:hypothetical protein [Cytophagaceae bacterium]